MIIFFNSKNQLNSNVVKRFALLEGARGFAALYVIFHHAVPAQWSISSIPVGQLFRFGQEAVILFFLLSGFVIRFSSGLREIGPFRDFFWKRFSRIYVPLIPTLIIGYGLKSLTVGRLEAPDFVAFFGNLLMLQDVSALKPGVIIDSYLGNTPLWSLSYEWWFYMLFFPLVGIAAAYRNLVVGSIVIFGALAHVVAPVFPWRVLAYLGIWWAGVEMAEAHLGLRSHRLGLRRALTFILAPGIILCVPIWMAWGGDTTSLQIGVHPWLEVRHFAAAGFILLLAMGWRRLHWAGSRFLILPWVMIAPVSYGIYILHTPLLIKATYLDGVVRKPCSIAIYSMVLVSVAWLLERRAYPWVRNRFRDKSSSLI